MKQDIHPEYTLATVHCACGNSFQTRSTQEDIHLDVCSVCHPFFTGKQRLMDTAGRVERFRRKWAKTEKAKAGTAKADGDEAAPEADEPTADADEAATAEAEPVEAGSEAESEPAS